MNNNNNNNFIGSSSSSLYSKNDKVKVGNYNPNQLSSSSASSSSSSSSSSSTELVSSINSKVKMMWDNVILKEIEESKSGDFKQHSELPIARIKKIVAADDDVRMVSAEVPIIFARACRMFIMEVSLRAYLESVASNRKTVQRGL